MEYKGRTYSKYRVWHPLDHIYWELRKNVLKNRNVGVGSYFRIVEVFGRNPDCAVDSVKQVTKPDHTALGL
jgi:hypothetical protein